MSNELLWQCQSGDCFLRDVGGKLHLFFVLTNPADVTSYGYSSALKVLSVNISSINPDNPLYDKTCVIQAGEHPFIAKESYVVYSRMMIDDVATIQRLLESGVFVSREPCSTALLKRILQGALDSDRTRQEFQNIIRENMPE